MDNSTNESGFKVERATTSAGPWVEIGSTGTSVAYYADTAEGGYCFPDFPHQGYDTNALYITINEFCGP